MIFNSKYGPDDDAAFPTLCPALSEESICIKAKERLRTLMTIQKMSHFPDNLGLATDLLLHKETGMVEARHDYIVVRTPDAPEYFFGNMLVMQQRPSDGDLKKLEHDFAQLVGM